MLYKSEIFLIVRGEGWKIKGFFFKNLLVVNKLRWNRLEVSRNDILTCQFQPVNKWHKAKQKRSFGTVQF